MNLAKEEKTFSTKNIVRVGILGAISFALIFVKFPLAMIAPPFMTIDISDVPALIAGFAMGPVYGVLVQLIKNLLNLSNTLTGGVGELSNFIVGSSYVLVSSIMYRKNKTIKRAAISLVTGVLVMSLIAMASNYFVVYPLYAEIMIPMDTLIGMGTAINSNIDTLWKMMIICVLPFNIIKGSINGIVTFLVYKRVRKYL